MARPWVPIPQTARFELIYTYQLQRVENCFWIHIKSGDWDATKLNTIAGRLVTWYGSSLKARQSSALSLERIVCTDFTSKYTPRTEYTTALPVAGTNATAPAANNVAAVISWHTAMRGRSYRGRTYHVGLCADQVSASTLAGGEAALLSTAYNALMTAINDATYELVVASQYNEGQWRAQGVHTPITSLSVDSNLASQRRRLIGRGQ